MNNTYSHKWSAFIGIALLSFGAYLDYTIVNVALPTIQAELKADITQLQWVMNIYFLALCILATIMGRCGDLYGRRRVFYLGVGVFGLASLLAGFSTSIHGLILARLLQGIGAAIVFPLGPSLLPASFPERERGKAIAWLGSLGGISLALGPVLGGLMVAYLGWRWIFFINIPIIVLGFWYCRKSVKESIADTLDRQLDWQGMLLLAFTMSGIVLGLIHGQTSGWSNLLTLVFLAVGFIAGFMLVKVELRKTNPLIDFTDFQKPLFYAGGALVLLAGVMSAVALFFDPLYLQIVRQQSPELSGLVLFAIPIAVFLVAFAIEPLIQRLGIMNTIILGLLLAVLAAFLPIFFNQNTAIIYVLFAFICLGSMWAMGNTVSLIAAQTAVGPHRASVATGTMVTMFNIGGSIGLAIAVVIYHIVTTKLWAYLQQQPTTILQPKEVSYLSTFLANPSASLQTTMSDTMHVFGNRIFMAGFTAVMWFLFIFSTLVLLNVLLRKFLKKN